MQNIVVNGAACQCANGSVLCRIMVDDPVRKMEADGEKAVVESDVSINNIKTFGMCNNLGNPSVASATAAAHGVLTPMPCIPVMVGNWQGNANKLKIKGKKAVSKDSTNTCVYGGCISIVSANEDKIKSE